MNKSIIVISEELEVANKKSMLDKEDEAFLLDEENPYFSVKNEEKKVLVFKLCQTIHWGMLKNNLLSIIEEKFPTFIGSVFKDIKGINEFQYEKSYFLYIMGEKNKKMYEKVKAPKESGIYVNVSDDTPTGVATTIPYSSDWGVAPTPPISIQTQEPTPTSAHPQVRAYQNIIMDDQISGMSPSQIREFCARGSSAHREIEERQRRAVQREEALREAYNRERDLIRGEDSE